MSPVLTILTAIPAVAAILALFSGTKARAVALIAASHHGYLADMGMDLDAVWMAQIEFVGMGVILVWASSIISASMDWAR